MNNTWVVPFNTWVGRMTWSYISHLEYPIAEGLHDQSDQIRGVKPYGVSHGGGGEG
jgi:hypothetical protein